MWVDRATLWARMRMRGHLSREEIVGRSDRDSGCWHVHLKSTEFTGVWCRGVEVLSNIEAMITSGDYDDEAVLLDVLFRDVEHQLRLNVLSHIDRGYSSADHAKTSLDVVFLK